MKIFASFALALLLSASTALSDAPAADAQHPVSAVVVTIDGIPAAIVYALADGSQGIVSFHACAENEQCKTDMKALDAAGKIGIAAIHSANTLPQPQRLRPQQELQTLQHLADQKDNEGI